MKIKTLLCTSILSFACVPAFAADTTGTSASQQASQNDLPPLVVLDDWAYADLYRAGWSAERMFDEAEVIGADGDDIGDVENILIGPDGNILSVIAQVGGLWDIGDTHVSIPWEQVRLSEDGSRLNVPVTEETVEDYSLLGSYGYFVPSDAEQIQTIEDDLATSPRVFKASELIGDYAFLTGDERYGYVSDLIFSDDGTLHAVVVEGDGAGTAGYRAYPYYGYDYGWSPNQIGYHLPYSRDEITAINTFDYDQMRGSGSSSGSGDVASADDSLTTGDMEDLSAE